MKRPLLALLVTLAVALPATAGAATAPTISITSPANGATFSRSIWETIPVTGNATFGEPVATTRTFYVRRDGCGTAADNPHLSVQQGTDAGDGCGSLFPQPAISATGDPFSAVNGVPFTLDATKKITGTIKFSSYQGIEGGPVGFGVGQVTMTARLTGIVGNQSRVLGSATATHLVTPSQVEYTTPIDITPPAADNGKRVSGLTLDLSFTGPAVLCDFVAMSGASFVTIPILDVGTVEVSSDSATFAPAKTVQATMATDGTWSAEVVVPNTGPRKIYARAIQTGSSTVNATPVSITVTA
jgi:hypothetical protein